MKFSNIYMDMLITFCAICYDYTALSVTMQLLVSVHPIMPQLLLYFCPPVSPSVTLVNCAKLVQDRNISLECTVLRNVMYSGSLVDKINGTQLKNSA